MQYFGTDGIRGRVGERITQDLCYRLGQYFSQKRTKVIIARDTRTSSDCLFASLSSSILDQSDVYDIGVASTPCLAYLTKKLGFPYGIMISASHNKDEDNGIKIFQKNGAKLTKKEEEQIEAFLHEPIYFPKEYKGKMIAAASWQQLYLFYLYETYQEANFPTLSILVDDANGAMKTHVYALFDMLSIPYHRMDLRSNRINDDCGASCPNTIWKQVQKGKYDLGISFDGDGDRLMLATKERIIDGDDLLYYFYHHVKKPCDGVVVTTFSSFEMKEKFQKENVKVTEVDVGDVNIAREIHAHPSWIGAERSGHIILPSFHQTGDGLFAVLAFLSTLCSKEALAHCFPKKRYDYHIENLPLPKSAEIYQNLVNEVESLKQNVPHCSIKMRRSGTERCLRFLIETPKKSSTKQVVAALKTCWEGK